jgi:hypothetical protein
LYFDWSAIIVHKNIMGFLITQTHTLLVLIFPLPITLFRIAIFISSLKCRQGAQEQPSSAVEETDSCASTSPLAAAESNLKPVVLR